LAQARSASREAVNNSMALKTATIAALSGSSLTFKVWRDTTVADVKSMIAAAWLLPAHAQDLVMGSQVVSDDCPLSLFQASSDADGCLHFAMISRQKLVPEDLVKCFNALDDESTDVRHRAVQDIQAWCGSDDSTRDCAIALVSKGLLSVRNVASKRALMQVLLQIAGIGDNAMISIIVLCLKDASEWIRLDACTGLSKVANRGDMHALAGLRSVLQSRCTRPESRAAAIMALADIAPQCRNDRELRWISDVVEQASEDRHQCVRNALMDVGGYI
jgi:HEAT repeat protein